MLVFEQLLRFFILRWYIRTTTVFPIVIVGLPMTSPYFCGHSRCPPNKKPLRSWEPWWAPHWQRGHKYLALARRVFSCQAYHGQNMVGGQPSHVNPGLGDIRIQRIETKPAKGLSDYPAKVWHCAKWEVHKKKMWRNKKWNCIQRFEANSTCLGFEKKHGHSWICSVGGPKKKQKVLKN